MMVDDLIPPTVVTVGGFPSKRTSTQVDERPLEYGNLHIDASPHHDFPAQDTLQRHSYRSSISASSLHSMMRDGHSQSSSNTSGSRRSSSPSLRDHEFDKHYSARTEQMKAERAKAKQDIKDKNHALRALGKSDKILGRVPPSTVPATSNAEIADLSFSDMLDTDPTALPAPAPSTSAGGASGGQATREQLKQDKASLKAHLKNLKETMKEEEKARKEAAKLEKLKAAVQARNDKIDAHDRAVRERQALKQAQKQAKADAQRHLWNHQAKVESEAIWQDRGHNALLAKTHALRV